MAEKALIRVVLRPCSTPQGEGVACVALSLAAANRPLLFCSLCQPDYRPDQLGQLLDKPTSTEKKDKEIDHVHLMTGYRAAAPVARGLRILGWLWRVLCWVGFSYRPLPLPGWLGWRGHAGGLLARIMFALRSRDVACPVQLFRRDIFGAHSRPVRQHLRPRRDPGEGKLPRPS